MLRNFNRSRGPRAACLFVMASALYGDPMTCSVTHYKASPGLTAAVADNTATITWDGDNRQELRLRLVIDGGTPIIQELAIHDGHSKRQGGAWTTLMSHAMPDFRVVSGLRRITNQQLDPLAGLGVKITQEVVDREKWEAFWDAPLNIPGGEAAHNNTTPPQRGVLNQPGLPRKPEEVRRDAAIYHAQSCDIETNGARLEVSFPGVQLGVFAGRLQYTVYKGTNLIRQEIIAKTAEPSVAYKYDAGVKGVKMQPGTKVAWRDLKNSWQEHRFFDVVNPGPVPVKANNRALAADVPGGSITTFPPPHNFFWAREIDYNLGYNWYRYDGGSAYSFGVMQAEREESVAQENRGSEDRSQNFTLKSARPGTWQRMPVYFYASTEAAPRSIDAALAFTRGDRFKPLPGYQVMATHFHMGMVRRARQAGGLGARVPDLEVMKAAGIKIVAPIDGGGYVRFPAGAPAGMDDPKWFHWSRDLGAPLSGVIQGEGEEERPRPKGNGVDFDPFKAQADYYETARLQSNQDFVVMPNAEILRGEVSRALGGHSDVFVSHPTFWAQDRVAGQPLVENNPKYGKVYHLGSTADMMEMTHRENLLIFMPHPRSKGSAGFPDGVKDTAHFLDANYRGIGFRWGMGLDGSEQRLCEYRCLPVLDDMNNWVADKATPPKFIQAISEVYEQSYGDDIYANNPVNYVKIDALPPPGEWSPIVNAMAKGDYFVTSGEVLIPSYSVEGTGRKRTIVADVQWTFPLEFVEVVWGDGKHTDRQVISATGLPAFGSHRFQIPFVTDGKKWVRFAAWDSAGNGAMVQPIKLASASGGSGAAR
ncbi:MAG: hypothetical protein ABI833_13780 [Acidobacteriota bacterium]